LLYVRIVGAVLVLSLALVTFIGVRQAAAQDTQLFSHSVTIASDPPGAMIWKIEGRDLACTNTLTPGTVELAFHGDNDLQRLRVRRFGYTSVDLDVKSSDKAVRTVLNLSKYVTSSFLIDNNAPPEVKQFSAALKEEFEKTLLANPEAFRCAPFDLDSIRLTKNNETGAVELNVTLGLDRSFGGIALRQASHVFDAPDRRQKMGRIALDNGIAEVLARFHGVAAKFPEIKDIVVVGSYATTQARLGTEEILTPKLRPVMETGGRTEVIVDMKLTKQDVVKNQDAVETIVFVMPIAQIPDTMDKKAISDAVLSVGKIGLADMGDNLPGLLNARDRRGWTLLTRAVQAENVGEVKRLLAQGADVNIAGEHRAPLEIATDHENMEMVKLLLAHGANPKDDNALCWANSTEMAELLLAHEANVNARKEDGNTPLHMAAIRDNVPLAELLLAHGADVNAKNEDGNTPLHLAAYRGNVPLAELLLAHGADVNAKNYKDIHMRTPLCAATWSNQSKHVREMVRMLQRHGGKVH